MLDTGTVAPDTRDGYDMAFYDLGQDYTARYLRWTFTDATVSYGDIGYLWAGSAWRPPRNFSYGLGVRWEDPSETETSLDGDLMTGGRRRRRIAEFSLDNNTPAEMMANPFEIDRLAGTTQTVLLRLDPDNYPVQWSLMGTIERATPLVLAGFARMGKRYSIRER